MAATMKVDTGWKVKYAEMMDASRYLLHHNYK